MCQLAGDRTPCRCAARQKDSPRLRTTRGTAMTKMVRITLKPKYLTESTARHEAGHAIAAALSGFPPVSVSLKPGLCGFAIGPFFNVRRLAKTLLAGEEAERKYLDVRGV